MIDELKDLWRGDTHDHTSLIVNAPDPNLVVTLGDNQRYWCFVNDCFQLHRPSILIDVFGQQNRFAFE